MILPFEKKEQTLADLKPQHKKFRTRYYKLFDSEGMNQFLSDLEDVINNPTKHEINHFNFQREVSGAPYVVIRYYDDEKVEAVKDRRYKLYGRIYIDHDFEELDKVINSYDGVNVILLSECDIVIKEKFGETFFKMLIWTETSRPSKSRETLNGLRQFLSSNLR